MTETCTTVKIDNRIYKVKLHFNEQAKESFEDKVLRMAKTDAEKMNRHSA